MDQDVAFSELLIGATSKVAHIGPWCIDSVKLITLSLRIVRPKQNFLSLKLLASKGKETTPSINIDGTGI